MYVHTYIHTYIGYFHVLPRFIKNKPYCWEFKHDEVRVAYGVDACDIYWILGTGIFNLYCQMWQTVKINHQGNKSVSICDQIYMSITGSLGQNTDSWGSLPMMPSLRANPCSITGPLKGESTSHWCKRQGKRSFYVYLVVSLNKLLNKQSICLWFEIQWCSFDISIMSHCFYAILPEGGFNIKFCFTSMGFTILKIIQSHDFLIFFYNGNFQIEKIISIIISFSISICI